MVGSVAPELPSIHKKNSGNVTPALPPMHKITPAFKTDINQVITQT